MDLLALRPRGRDYDGEEPVSGASFQLAFRVAPDQVDICHDELVAKGKDPRPAQRPELGASNPVLRRSGLEYPGDLRRSLGDGIISAEIAIACHSH